MDNAINFLSAKAEVVDKYKPDIASKYPGIFKRDCYIVVFEAKGM